MNRFGDRRTDGQTGASARASDVKTFLLLLTYQRAAPAAAAAAIGYDASVQ